MAKADSLGLFASHVHEPRKMRSSLESVKQFPQLADFYMTP